MKVIYPGNPLYGELRQDYNSRFQSYPESILLPESAKDVSDAILYCVSSGLPFSVKSGGHSFEGQSLSNGIIIDLTLINKVTIDTYPSPTGYKSNTTSVYDNAICTISVGPGVTIGNLYKILKEHNLIFPAGTCPPVGIGGITLSGGIGYLTRYFGLTLDSLIEAEVVLSDGKIVKASETSYSDLFWALRGGGGSFGIVTSCRFKAYRDRSSTVFQITWKGTLVQLSNILYFWQKWAYEAPDEMTCSMDIYPDTDQEDATSASNLGRGKQGVNVGTKDIPILLDCEGIYLGNSRETMQLLTPIVQLPSGRCDIQLREMNVSDSMLELTNKDLPLHTKFKVKSNIANKYVPLEFFNILLQSLLPTDMEPSDINRSISLYPMGGNMNTHKEITPKNMQEKGTSNYSLVNTPTSTAFPHRGSIFWIQLSIYWLQSESYALKWVQSIYDSLYPYLSGYTYANWPDTDLSISPKWPYSYYSINYPRLQAIKRKYDPFNRIKFKQSIIP